MPETRFKVEVQGDHLEKLTHARPILALAEMIWNSLDADATSVNVETISDDMGMQSVTVRDNGHGIPPGDVPHLFGRLGGSWKANGARSKTKSRMLHGREGRGRFKALALGRVVDWFVVSGDDERRQQYTITIIKDNLIDVRVSDPSDHNGDQTGVEVRVTELHHNFLSLERENAAQELSEIFALYLSDYSDVTISLNSKNLDPSTAIASQQRFNLSPLEEEGTTYDIDLDLIEWNTSTDRVVYLCSEDGFPFHRRQPRFHTHGFQFSAYLRSKYISKLHEEGVLDLAEMEPTLQNVYDEAQDRIKAYFKGREAETARSEIEQWKAERVYPYLDEPQSTVEQAERQVFDIVALNVNRLLPEFSESGRKTKAFQLRMLRQAIGSGSEELQLILNEVLDLPEQKQKELAKLLEEASLANVISASRLVADRLKFLNGLEALLFDPEHKSRLKERSQLHRIIADNNTWLFGEEFNLTVDDQSLTEVLRKHRNLIGKDTQIDHPVLRLDGTRGIVDLMLSRAVPQSRPDEREHLVVELKRPTVKIGSKEISQVKQYAFAIAEDERFESLATRWTFWVISNAFGPTGKHEARQSDRPFGQVYKTENIVIWCKTWAEVLEAAKSRMRFFGDSLEANIDKESSLRFLKETYNMYLSGEVDQRPDEDASTVSSLRRTG